MADPDEALTGRESSAASAEASPALIESIAEALRNHNIECTGLGEVTCRGCRELGWMSWSAYRKHVARAMVAHLGLVEETKLIPEWVDLGPCNGTCGMVGCNPEHRARGLNWVNKRRLVSRWTEVDHGSE